MWTMGEGVFDDLVDLILGKLIAKMTFVTFLTATFFLTGHVAVLIVAVLVLGVDFVTGTRFFRLDNVRRRRFR